MIILLSVRHAMNAVFGRRFDGAPSLPYYHGDDLGLEEERFSFYSQHGWKLYGSRYYVKNTKFKGLVVFFHGLGDGRASYVKSISLLAEAGYLVYAYDNTGCMESEGNKIYSFEHTLIDQEYFFEWLDKDPKAKGLKRYAVGHSWGGYSAAVSAKHEYKIEKIVDIAGFNSATSITIKKFPKGLQFLKPFVWLNFKISSGKYACKSAVEILKKSSAKVLYIQGKNDTAVTLDDGYLPLYDEFKNDPSFKFIIKDGRGHSVYKSPRAEEYCNRIMEQGITNTSIDKKIEMDIKKATEEDKEIWKEILSFLES